MISAWNCIKHFRNCIFCVELHILKNRVVDRVAVDSLLISRPLVADVGTLDAAEHRRRIIMTLVWFTVSLLIALFIPNIGVVISLLGGLAAIFIFVFPGQLYCFC